MARFFKRFGSLNDHAEDYAKSNAVETIPNLPHLAASYRSAIVDADSDTPAFRQRKVQAMVDYVCEKMSIPSVDVIVVDTPYPHKTNDRGKFNGGKLGHYVRSGNRGVEIKLWNLTAMKGKRIANKSFFGTAVHELCHHLDYEVLKLGKSLHTAGFYKRIGALEKAMGG